MLYNLQVTATKKVDGKLYKQSGTIANGVMKIGQLSPVEEDAQESDPLIYETEIIEAVCEESSATTTTEADFTGAEPAYLLLEQFNQHWTYDFFKRVSDGWELLIERLFTPVEYKLASDF